MYITPFRIIILLCFVIGFTSCDHTTYITIRNYKEPCSVNVTYQKSGNTFFDNDTLRLKHLDHSTFDSFLVRVNSSSDSYSFIAPQKKEIMLRPTSLGQPIKQVKIFTLSDSSWTINLWDKKEFKQLKKAGKIKTKGFVFRTSIFIENK